MTTRAQRGVAYELWRQVDAVCRERGWSDAELERQSGVSRVTFRRLETTTRRPMRHIVNGLAKATGIDRDEAYRLAGYDTDEQDGAAGDWVEMARTIVADEYAPPEVRQYLESALAQKRGRGGRRTAAG